MQKPNPANSGQFNAYNAKAVDGVWKIWPAEGPGGVLTAARFEFINVHGVSRGDHLVLYGSIKVNGIRWLGDSDAVVDYVKFQPPDQTVQVPVMAAKGSAMGDIIK